MALEKPAFAQIDDPANTDWLYRFDGTSMAPKRSAAWGTEASHPFVSGYWHPSNPLGTAGLAPGNGQIFYTPYVVPPGATTLTGIAVNITAAGAGTAMVVRMGVYTCDATMKPATLLLDAGTIDATVAGERNITGLSLDLSTRKWVWLAVVAQATTYTTAPTIRAHGGHSVVYLPTATSAAAARPDSGYSHTGVAGALPASVGAIALDYWAPSIPVQLT